MSDERLRLMFGFALLAIIAGLAVAIGLGKVEEKTSFGLPVVLNSLAFLAGQFAQWAFGGGGKGKDKE